MESALRPEFKILSSETIETVIEEAKHILHELGFFLENHEALELLDAAGASIDAKRRQVFLPPEMIERAVTSAPATVCLYDTAGEFVVEMGSDTVCFDPGSAALNVLDPETNEIRPALTPDFVAFSKVVDQLEHIRAQSTAMICSDIPQGMADRYRLYLALLYSKKPIVTGTFAKESFNIMKEMLVAVRGSTEALKKKPLAIFDACPSPPLKWSEEYVSMPLTGATAPITLLGAIVQHAAETLAGVVISQTVQAGAPVIWGGSPSAFDMRHGTTPMGSIDTMLIDLGYSEIGKHLNLPTHAYMGMSDAKLLDAQTGLESGMGSLLAGIKGINMISGAGMLNFESTQSIQKLVIDNEICGMTYKFLRGIGRRDEPIALDLLKSLISDQQLLDHEHTLRWFRTEHFLPSQVIDRSNFDDWSGSGKTSIGQRALVRVNELIEKYPGISLEPAIQTELTGIMLADAVGFGLSALPDLESP
jgi:trimethylamine--corrinoid protein Co-methyltransferase